jgi:hypothetical protein
MDDYSWLNEFSPKNAVDEHNIDVDAVAGAGAGAGAVAAVTAHALSTIEFININQSILILDNKADNIIGETGNASNDYYHADQSKILDHKEYEYNKKWCKLDKHQKINRLMNYIKTMTFEEEGTFRKTQSLLVDLIMNKCAKSCTINYCETEGKIISIPDLKYSSITKLYYIGDDISDISITIKDCPATIKPFKELNLKALFKK